MVHQKVHSIGIWPKRCKLISRVRKKCSSREMDQDNMFSLPFFKEISDIVKVKMFTNSSSSTMIFIKERALGDDDFCLCKFIPLQEVTPISVTGVSNQRDLGLDGDLLPFTPDSSQFTLWEILILRL